MSRADELSRPAPSSGFEQIIEDVFGFNFRSFRTLADLLVRPNQVFRAFKDYEHEQYTPLLRVWLGMTIILSVLSFFFHGFDQQLIRQAESNPAFAAQITQLSDAPLEEFAATYGSTFLFLQPILVGGFVCLNAFMVALFDKGLRWTARINLAFAPITAGSILGLALFPFQMRFPEIAPYSSLAIILLYWTTLFRGIPGVLSESFAGRFLKTTALTLTLTLSVVLSGAITFAASLVYAARTLAGSG